MLAKGCKENVRTCASVECVCVCVCVCVCARAWGWETGQPGNRLSGWPADYKNQSWGTSLKLQAQLLQEEKGGNLPCNAFGFNK